MTTSEKSSRRDEVSAHTVTFLKIVAQNAPDCILAHIHFKKFRGGMPPEPPYEARGLRRILSSVFEKIRVHTHRIRIVFARPHENAKQCLKR